MTENNSLDKLFAANQSKEQFISNYNELKIQGNDDEDMPSIFKSGLSLSLSEIYDIIDVHKDNCIDEDEINILKNYSAEDGKNVLSEDDLTVLYEKTLDKLMEDSKTKTPSELYDINVVQKQTEPTVIGESPACAYLTTLENKISSIKQLIKSIQITSESKKQRYQSELDSLIVRESNLSQKEKETYLKNSKKNSGKQ